MLEHLINEVIKKVTEAKVSQVVPIPGPSAVSVAASISGFYMNKFTFLGFPPKKRKRKKFFEEALDYEHPVIFYESPYRILKTLQEICDIDPENETVVCRELTKMHETIYRGSAQKVLEDLEAEKHTKGEFTVIIKN
jgi:16S rRNA (cytidine1402-2'-O)-methyltransferase